MSVQREKGGSKSVSQGQAGKERKRRERARRTPLNNLLVRRPARRRAVADGRVAERVGEDQATERVTTLVGTVRVHLASVVFREHVDLLLVDEADDLHVVGSL